MAALPGAPVRVEQVATNALAPGGDTAVPWAAGSSITGTPATFRFPIGLFPPGLGGAEQLAGTVQESLVFAFVNDGRLLPAGTLPAGGILAQEAVEWALLRPFDPSAEQDVAPSGPDSQAASPAVAGAARRFAALPPAARHAWLAANLDALRAGQITLAELP